MVGTRPRRALRPRLAIRVVWILVPALALGGTATGVTVAWSDSSTRAAVPAPRATASEPVSSTPSALPTATPSSRATAPAKEDVAKEDAAKAAKEAAAARTEARKRAGAEPRVAKAKTDRAKVTAVPLRPKVVGHRYATVGLNVRTAPNAAADVLAVLDAGDKVAVSSTVRSGFRLVSHRGQGRWAKDQYLTKDKPTPKETKRAANVPSAAAGSGSASPRKKKKAGDIPGASCAKGASIESGLTPDAVKVTRALCARYPQISSFGGRRPADPGNHGSGRAVDTMISNSAVGWQMARWLRANAGRLGISEVIYSQKIWTVQRGGEGWRPMSDRGSASANHHDHVHVSVYGNAAAG